MSLIASEEYICSMKLTISSVMICLCTARFNIQNSVPCPRSAFMCSVQFSQPASTISLHINWLVSLIEAQCSPWCINWIFIHYKNKFFKPIKYLHIFQPFVKASELLQHNGWIPNVCIAARVIGCYGKYRADTHYLISCLLHGLQAWTATPSTLVEMCKRLQLAGCAGRCLLYGTSGCHSSVAVSQPWGNL